MPTTTNDGVTLHYKREGSGETVTFIGEAGYGPWQWAWQYDALAGAYETLLWDIRGSGRSDAPDGPYSVAMLASDLEAVLAENAVRRTHLVGVGLGGMIALRYAREYSRAKTLTLFGTAPGGAHVDQDALDSLHPGTFTDEALETTLVAALSESFRQTQTELVDRICGWRREDDADQDAFEAQVGAIHSFEAGPLYELTLPTLVCHGLDDPIVATETGRELAEELPRGIFEPVEGKHLCFVEHARAVTDRLDGFLAEHSDDDENS